MSVRNCKSTLYTMDTRDWNLCQADDRYRPTVGPSSSVKLRNSAERLSACYKVLVDNIQELKEVGDLSDFVATDDTGGDDSTESRPTVQLMMSSHKAVWHITYRNAADNQKVQTPRNKHQEQETISPVKSHWMDSDARSSTQASHTPHSCLSEPVDAPCICCDEVGNKRELGKAAILGLDKKISDCAGDVITINAVYHHACLTRLYRKAEKAGCDTTDSHKTQAMRAHVLNEIQDFTEDNCGLEKSLELADMTTV